MTQTDLPQVRVDHAAHQAWLGEKLLTLTNIEFRLLSHLVANAGQVIPRLELLREGWGTTWMNTKSVDMHISWLRRKLGDDAAQPRYITTVRSVGVRFEANAAAPAEQPSTTQETAEASDLVETLRLLIGEARELVGQLSQHITSTKEDNQP